jgi:hypothetical protein
VSVNYVFGTVLERSSPTFLRQITGAGDVLIDQTEVASISYDVWEVPMSRNLYQSQFGALPLNAASLLPNIPTGVLKNITYGRVLPVNPTILNSPKTDLGWNLDTIGYNFSATLPPIDFPLIPLVNFPNPIWEQIIFRITPVVGNEYSIGFIVMVAFDLSGRRTGSGSGTGF